MDIQVNTDHTISGPEAKKDRVKAAVEGALGYLSEYMTRVEVHLSDETATKPAQTQSGV